MKSAVIVFPGSNCDRDVSVALHRCFGTAPLRVWHDETNFPAVDLIVLPGGFSFGDYLRAGAMSARASVMREVVARAEGGVPVLGICNGFQMLAELGLLPGTLMRNAGLRFVCRNVGLRVERNDTSFTNHFAVGEVIHIPVAHNDGNYFADDETLRRLDGEGLVVMRYATETGETTPDANPNGSRNNIASIINATGNVLGLMPHPERAADECHGGMDGGRLFESVFAESRSVARVPA